MDWGTTTLQMVQVAVVVAFTDSDVIKRRGVGDDDAQLYFIF